MANCLHLNHIVRAGGYAFTRFKRVQPESVREEFRGFEMTGWQKQARNPTVTIVWVAAMLLAAFLFCDVAAAQIAVSAPPAQPKQ